MKNITRLFVVIFSALVFTGCNSKDNVVYKFFDGCLELCSDFWKVYMSTFKGVVKGDLFEIFVCLVLTGIIILLALMLLSFIFSIINYTGVAKMKGSGSIIDKEHETGSTLVMVPLATGGTIPVYNKIDNYILKVELDRNHKKSFANFYANKNFYQKIEKGQKVLATYKVGRLDKVLKICSLQTI